MQKKQLVTDILIEEYQKELKRVRRDLEIFPESRVLSRAENIIEGFIERLQSLRQQEVQNVKEGYESGYKDSILIDKNESPVSNSPEHYFTQTFEAEMRGK